MLGYTWPRGARNQIKYPQIHEIRKLRQSSNEQSTKKYCCKYLWSISWSKSTQCDPFWRNTASVRGSKQLPQGIPLETNKLDSKTRSQARNYYPKLYIYIHSLIILGVQFSARATLINSSSCSVFFRFFTKCEAFLAVWWIECLRKPLCPVLWQDQRPGQEWQECDSDGPLPLQFTSFHAKSLQIV